MELTNAIRASSAGMKVQGMRLRVVAQNIANADSVAHTPDGSPYRRQVISFKNELDRKNDVSVVKVDKVTRDQSDFQLRYDPGHPYANPDGYVRMPNVNSLIEMMDMREAQRSYEANINMVESARSMLQRTVDLLRA